MSQLCPHYYCLSNHCGICFDDDADLDDILFFVKAGNS